MKRFYLYALSIVLLGCGGNGSDADSDVEPTATAVTVPVLWQARTRSIEGHALGRSVIVKLASKQGSQSGFTQTFDRSTSSATLSNYRSAQTVMPGLYYMTAEFFSDLRGNGYKVAVAEATVQVLTTGILANPDGSRLGPITVDGLVSIHLVSLTRSLKVGLQSQVAVRVMTGQGIWVLPEDARTCEQLAGQEFATVAKDCTIDVLAAGRPIAIRVSVADLTADATFDATN